MKLELVVFYAWQSDRRDTRGLVGSALERAVKTVTRSGDVEHAARVDADTCGRSGSPDIANTILDKIRASDVFVADVTLRDGGDRVGPNPNVLVELGFAAAELGWERVVMVMNDAYGGPEQLPFDLRGRRVLRFSKAEEEKPAEPRKMLQRALERALKTTVPRRKTQAIEPRPCVGWGADLRETLTLIAPVLPVPLEADRRRRRMFGEEELAKLSDEDRKRAEGYNEVLATHCDALELLRDAELRWLRCKNFGQEVRLSLANEGRAPLEGVIVELSFPEGFEVYEQDKLAEEPDFPLIPKRPRFGGGGRSRRSVRIPGLAAERPSSVAAAVLGMTSELVFPSVSMTETGLYLEHGRAVGWSARVKHGFQRDFEDPLVVVPASTGEYRVEVEVHADNLPDPHVAVLRIVVRPLNEDDRADAPRSSAAW